MILNKNETLFWGVFRSIVIRNKIFKEMKLMKYEFKSIEGYHIKNRITLGRVRSLGWYLKRNEINLLKDRLLHTNNNNDYYLLIKSSCIDKLMEKCKDDMELMKLIYEKCKIQMDEYDLIFYSSNKRNYNALELFIKEYPSMLDKNPDSFILAITKGNLRIIKYLFETMHVGRNYCILKLKEFLKNYNHHYHNLSNDCCNYLIEINIFKDEIVPFISFKTYSNLNQFEFSKYLLDLNLVYTDLKQLEITFNDVLADYSNNKYEINKIENENIQLFFKKYFNYQNFNGISINDKIKDIILIPKEIKSNDEEYEEYEEDDDYSNSSSSDMDDSSSNDDDDDDGYGKLDKIFKLYNSYPFIKHLVISNLLWNNSFEEIESLIKMNLPNLKASNLLKFIVSIYQYRLKQRLSKSYYSKQDEEEEEDKDKGGESQLIHLKLLIKYEIKCNDDLNWWETEITSYCKSFSINQILELFQLIKSLNPSYDNTYKYSDIFLYCIPQIISNLNFDLMKFIIDSVNVNYEHERKDCAIECFNNFNLIKINSNENHHDQIILNFLDLILKFKIYPIRCSTSSSDNTNNYYLPLSNLIKSLYKLLFSIDGFIKSIHTVKSSLFENQDNQSFKQLISKITTCYIQDFVTYYNGKLQFIQIMVEQFSDYFDFSLALGILGPLYKYQNDENKQFFQILIDKVLSYCDNNNGSSFSEIALIEVLEILISINELEFLKFIVNKFENEIKECKIVKEFTFKSNQVASWFLNNCGNLVSINIMKDIFHKQSSFDINTIIEIYNYFKSNNQKIPFQQFYSNELNSSSAAKLLDIIIDEKSISMLKFYIQSHIELSINFTFQDIPLFNELVLNFQNNKPINDDEILKLIESISSRYQDKNNLNMKKRKLDDFDDFYNKSNLIDQEIQNNIDLGRLFKLVEFGELRLAIKLYSKLKGDNNISDDDGGGINNNYLKTFIKIDQFKSIIKYQDLDIVLDLFEMTSMYYGTYACNQIVKWSILYNRIDIYNHFKLLHNENIIKYGVGGNNNNNYGIITIGFLLKPINPKYFKPFIFRKDLPMFKFLLNQYLNNQDRSGEPLTDENKNQLIQQLYNFSIENNSNQISNYLSTTYPKYCIYQEKEYYDNINNLLFDDGDDSDQYFNIERKYYDKFYNY